MQVKSLVWGGLLLAGLAWAGSIGLKHQWARAQAPAPQVILVLGGGTGREEAAAQLAASQPDLAVWVSSGDRDPTTTYAMFRQAGVSPNRVYLDYQATDTVTNFTTVVPQLHQRGYRHIYVITSDFHVPRARVIGTLVLGHHTITFTSIAVPSEYPPEPWLKIVRDGGRSLLWILTGRTGSRVGQRLQEQFPHWNL